MRPRYYYAVRIHDRNTEDDPHLATVMYSTNGPGGPWYDMATGEPGFAIEIMEALDLANSIINGDDD